MSAPVAPLVAVGADSGFSPRTVLGMLLIGLLGFVGLLYALGHDPGNSNDGGAHVGGKGLNGFAALAAMLAADGHPVAQLRSKSALTAPGLLVLTPPPLVDGKELTTLVDNRRYVGPTMIVAPKWAVGRPADKKAPKGWVQLDGVVPLNWPGFHDELGVSASRGDQKPAGGWVTGGTSGRRASGKLPNDRVVLSGAGEKLVPLVESGDGRILAAYLDDGEYYPGLEDFAGYARVDDEDDDGKYPVILVFEPDLLNNWGMADEATARMARALVLAAADQTEIAGAEREPITFDLTQNGFGGTQNLLTLAFRPPFLAATICLLLAGIAIAWRAFNRFGPPRRKERAIALGKSALVENSAGFIRKTGRVHLVAGPYADAARDRLAAALGLPRGMDAGAIDNAIDRAQQRRGIAEPLFSKAAADLRQARKPHEVARRAGLVQSIERALT